MTNPKVAVLFPGQGAFYKGALKESRTLYPQIDAVIAEIDAVAYSRLNASVAETLFAPRPAEISELLAEAPALLQVAIYGISVAAYKVLEAHGLRPDVLVGHSFGEIAAMVASGAFSVEQGAEIVLHRTAALAALAKSGGYMAALATSRAQAEKILDLVGGAQTAVAGENHRSQTVLSGAAEEMDRCAEVAKALKISFVKLNSPYAFHSPMVKGACADFAARIRPITAGRSKTPVFSPILGRYYSESDVLTECLAQHLVLPVNFAPGMERLYGEGVRTFIECGALGTLGKLTAQALGGHTDMTTVVTLEPAGESKSLGRAIEMVGGSAPAPVKAEDAERLLLPQVETEVFERFWAACGDRVREFTAELFGTFGQATPGVASLGAGTVADAVNKSVCVTDRATLFAEVTALYAEAMEYPQEVFTESVELEAELGIDSVKQTELLARLGERYPLPPRGADFKLSDYNTMGKIVDLVFAFTGKTPAPAPTPVVAPVVAPAGIDRGKVFTEVTALYAEAMEYPQEVFTESVELEAELGIDSVKQTELLARLGERYPLPPRGADFKLSDYNTMGKIADLVFACLQKAQPVARKPEGVKVNGAPPTLPIIPSAAYETGAYIN